MYIPSETSMGVLPPVGCSRRSLSDFEFAFVARVVGCAPANDASAAHTVTTNTEAVIRHLIKSASPQKFSRHTVTESRGPLSQLECEVYATRSRPPTPPTIKLSCEMVVRPPEPTPGPK